MSFEDYLSKYLRIKQLIEKGDPHSDNLEPTASFLEQISEDLERFASHLLPEVYHLPFVNIQLPPVAKALLDKKYFHSSYEVCGAVNSFFNKVLDLCISHLRREYSGLFECVWILLDYEKNFYNNKYVFVPCHIETELKQYLFSEVESTDEFICSVDSVGTVNSFFFFNLNYFALRGGFIKLLWYLSAGASIEQSAQILAFVATVHDYSYISVWKYIAEEACSKTITATLEMTDEEIRTPTKAEFQNLLKQLENVLEHMYPPVRLGEVLENFELDLALKLVKCPFLEKRIFGVTQLKHKVEQAKNHDEEYKSPRLAHFRDTAKWLDSEKLLGWIDQHDLFELLFGSTAHPEVLKRGSELIRFLYDNARFTQEHFDVIWDSALVKHEAHRDAIMKLIQDISSSLNSTDIQYLFSKVTQIPYTEIDNSILTLVKTLAEPTGRLPRKNKFNTSLNEEQFETGLALEFLWSLSQEQAYSSGVPKPIISQSATILQGLLLRCRGYRTEYIAKCMENIKKNSCVVSSCKLLEKLLTPSAHSGLASSVDETNLLINQLETNHGLIKELYSSFLLFRMEAAKIGQSFLQASENPDDDTFSTCSSRDEDEDYENRKKRYESLFKQVSVSCDIDLNYAEEVKSRLGFLRFLYGNSTETIRAGHMKVLWESLVTLAFCETDQVEFFNWILALVNSCSSYSITDYDGVHYVFVELLLSLDPRYYSSHAFSCFEKYFILVNKRHGLLKKSKFYDDLEVYDTGLLGISYLWEIILQARDEVTYRNSFVLLKKLYKGARKSKEDIQKEFLANCMRNLRKSCNSLKATSSPDPITRVHRALMMIVSFIEEFEGPEDDKYEKKPIKVRIINKIQKYDQRLVKMNLSPDITIGNLKNNLRIDLNLDVTIENLQLSSAGQVFDKRFDSKTLWELKIRTGQTLALTEKSAENDFLQDAFPVPHSAESKETLIQQLRGIFESLDDELLNLALEKSGWVAESAIELLTDSEHREKLQTEITEIPFVRPSRLSELIANTQEYFNLLFELLELGLNSVSSEIWNLLTKIPVNKEIYNKLMWLEIKDFSREPDWDSLLPPQCSYKLYYSLQIIVNFFESDALFNEKSQWRIRYLELGGFIHLYRVLMSMEISTDYSIAKCLKVLLQVLQQFIRRALYPESKDLQSFEAQKIRLPHDLSQKVIRAIDFQLLTLKLLKVMNFCIKNCENPDSIPLVNISLKMLSKVVSCRPYLFETLINSDCYLAGLLECPKRKIRKSLYLTLSLLVAEFPESTQFPPKQNLLTRMLSCLPMAPNPFCDQYFYLLTSLIVSCKYIDLDLLYKCIEVITSRPILEDRKIGDQDNVLTGHFTLLTTLLKTSCAQIDLLEFTKTVYRMLFEVPQIATPSNDSTPPICKHPSTRKAAFNLLLDLSSLQKDIAQFLLKKLYLNHSEFKYHGSFDTEISPRSPSGYVGLMNFGCTCYMNSLLQQLFMIPSLRENILKTPVSGENIMENLLYQLQSVFCHLQESEKEYYVPYGFCTAFKGYNEEPLNLHVQQDVDEFFNLLCDKLEELMKPTHNKNLLRNEFGGSLIHEIVSIETEFPYRSETEEQFLRISLEIKNKKTLSEALDLFIKEDVLDGENKYYCGQYDQKIDVKKRCLIGSLSNTVFIHLKRFEFDFTTMQRYKINDYCEFPVFLNLKPWSKDGILGLNDYPDSYYEYELVGVLVHSGIADAGHYYSFIKDRVTSKWFKFDDRHIDEFAVENLKKECFGDEGAFCGVHYQTFAKTKSAYMLVYERVSALPHTGLSCTLHLPAHFSLQTDELNDQTWKENMKFLKDLLFFDDGYTEFVMNFVDSYAAQGALVLLSHSEDSLNLEILTSHIQGNFESLKQFYTDTVDKRDMETLQERCELARRTEEQYDAVKLAKLSTLFAFELLLKANKTDNFITWMISLQGIYCQHAPACLWLLKYLLSSRILLQEIILEHKETDVRTAFSEFLSCVLKWSSLAEKDRLFESTDAINIESYYRYRYIEPTSPEDRYDRMMTSATGQFMKSYLKEIMLDARKNWRRFNEFFWVIKEFISSGLEQCKLVLLLDGNILFLHFLMNEADPFNNEAVVMGDQLSDPDMTVVLEILQILVTSTLTKAMRNSELTIELPELGSETEMKLQDPRVYRNILTQINHKSVARITCHLVWNSQIFTGNFMGEILSKVLTRKVRWDEANYYLKLLSEVLTLDDDQQFYRVELLWNMPMISGGIISSQCTFFDYAFTYNEIHSMFVIMVVLWLSDMLEIPHIFLRSKLYINRVKKVYEYVNELKYQSISHSVILDYSGKSRYIPSELKNISKILKKAIKRDSDSDMEKQDQRLIEGEKMSVESEDNDGSDSDNEIVQPDADY